MLSLLRMFGHLGCPISLASLFFAATLAAQSTGPLNPPPANGPAPSAPGATAPKPAPKKVTLEDAPITHEPPAIPPQKQLAEAETIS